MKRALGSLSLALIGVQLAATAHALPLTNPGFEAGSTGWNLSSDAFITNFPLGVASGTNAAAINTNGQVLQDVVLPGPGSYSFGVRARFSLINPTNPAGMFNQAQATFGVNGGSDPWATVGADPNSVRNTFTNVDGFWVSDWLTFAGVFNYTGGPTSAGLLNLNLQTYNDSKLLVSYDDAYVTSVPEPGTLGLLGLGLAGLGLTRRRRIA